jgi:hypothetical protein
MLDVLSAANALAAPLILVGLALVAHDSRSP